MYECLPECIIEFWLSLLRYCQNLVMHILFSHICSPSVYVRVTNRHWYVRGSRTLFVVFLWCFLCRQWRNAVNGALSRWNKKIPPTLHALPIIIRAQHIVQLRHECPKCLCTRLCLRAVLCCVAWCVRVFPCAFQLYHAYARVCTVYIHTHMHAGLCSRTPSNLWMCHTYVRVCATVFICALC